MNRSHSEIIRTCGRDVPPHAQDYNSQAYLDWLGTLDLPAPITGYDLQVRRVVDEQGGYVYEIVRHVWRK